MQNKYYVVYYTWNYHAGAGGPYGEVINQHPLNWAKEEIVKIKKHNNSPDMTMTVSFWSKLDEDYIE